MKKLVSKFLPVEPYDMRGLEEWLSAMAAQGLHLAYLGEYVARFEPGPPQPETRYALDVKQGFADLDPERNESYAQAGWEYVTTMNEMYYVYRTQDPSAPALHTDPVTQSYTFKWLFRRRRGFWAVIIFNAIFFFRKDFFRLLDNPWSVPELFLLDTMAACLFLALLVCYALLLAGIIRQRRAMKALQRQLADGIPLEDIHRRPRSIPRVLTDWGPFVFLICATLIFGFGIQPDSVQKLPLPEDWDFPHVTLEQVMEREDVVNLSVKSPQETLLPYPTRRRSLLLPEQIDFRQRGTALLEDGGAQECDVHLHLYRLRFPDTAPLLLRCVQESCLAGWRRYEKICDDISMNPKLVELSGFQNVNHPAFDQLTVLTWRTEDEESPRTRYIGRVGGLVFDLTCSGPADTDRALEILAEEVSA